MDLDFALFLAKYFQEHHEDILSSPVNRLASNLSLEAQSGEIKASGTVINRTIYRLLTAASDYVVRNLQNEVDDYNCPEDCCGKVKKLVRFCLDAGQTEVCQEILDAVFKVPRNETSKLHNVHIPTARDLCLLLREFELPVYSPPFVNFFRNVIEQLSRVSDRDHTTQDSGGIGTMNNT
jgi:hypothetical protein